MLCKRNGRVEGADMSCSLHSIELPKPKAIKVNGYEIPRALVSQEVQYHPSKKPIEAWHAAARALVIRQLLLAEAKRTGIDAEPADDGVGRRETMDEALIRTLVEREVATPEPTESECLRYYENNRARFRTETIYEANHILFPAPLGNAEEFAKAFAKAEACLKVLRADPSHFEKVAREVSACPSAAQDGNLGQLTEGQTTPEFEQALFAMAEGSISNAPVKTRYGVHIIRLNRKIAGNTVPFDFVKTKIADYLRECVMRRATAQYIARLVSRAEIEGITIEGVEAHRVN
jgi:peptidyl-prolyl cis-trans isomerase C